ncbi:hypothetical protein BDV97DRAFT_60007 [Delphinella strobiligena]|nr:hypothetical protein BDV97DRAFT_60007 [Delphinella strobiligena]
MNHSPPNPTTMKIILSGPTGFIGREVLNQCMHPNPVNNNHNRTLPIPPLSHASETKSRHLKRFPQLPQLPLAGNIRRNSLYLVRTITVAAVAIAADFSPNQGCGLIKRAKQKKQDTQE